MVDGLATGAEARAAQAPPAPTQDASSGEAALAPAATPLAGGAGVRRTYRIVRVVSVNVALPDQYPTVTLEDVEGHRERLAFRIGTSEGVAMAHALGGTTAPRPSTHDLFARALERYGVDILAVRLIGRVGATYLAEIELVGPGGRETLECRPSDGICLALRQRVPAPVLCDERLFTTGDDVPAGAPSAQDV